MKALRNILIVIAASAIAMTALYWAFNWLMPVHKPDGSWISVRGTVTSIAGANTSKGYLEFQIGERYHRVYSRNTFASVTGEVYPLIIDPKDPEDPDKLIVKTWEPLFSADDATSLCQGKITELQCHTTNILRRTPYTADCYVTFEYSVQGRRYFRSQTLPPGTNMDVLPYKPDQWIMVEYLKSMPQRARIQPIPHGKPALREQNL